MSPGDDHIVLFRRAPAELRRLPLESYARVLREEVAGGGDFRCLVTDDRELRRLNRQFLGKDYPTDVLSFPYRAATVRERSATLGELAISAQRAIAQAAEYGHSLEREIQILMLHGLLHLLGMDHETDRGRMARAESAWRRKLDLPLGLIERVRS